MVFEETKGWKYEGEQNHHSNVEWTCNDEDKTCEEINDEDNDGADSGDEFNNETQAE